MVFLFLMKKERERDFHAGESDRHCRCDCVCARDGLLLLSRIFVWSHLLRWYDRIGVVHRIVRYVPATNVRQELEKCGGVPWPAYVRVFLPRNLEIAVAPM